MRYAIFILTDALKDEKIHLDNFKHLKDEDLIHGTKIRIEQLEKALKILNKNSPCRKAKRITP
jgi:hypothetical protein